MSRISLSNIDKESDLLLINNRSKLKKIFSKHLPNREGKITLQEFFKFCQNVKILQVIPTQDLITPIELKKLVAQHSIKQTLAYLEFEGIIKSIALQTFNNTAPLFDKLRMLLIHIRNPCKMHYQVSLNQNITKDALEAECMQDPMEIEEGLKSQESPARRYSSISPARDNDSQTKLRAASVRKPLVKEPNTSPCTSIEILDKVLQNRLNFKPSPQAKTRFNPFTDLDRRKSVSPYRSISPMSMNQLKSVKSVFSSFCTKFEYTRNTPPRTFTAQRIQAQFKFIRTVRTHTFNQAFVKKMLFSAWRKVVKEKLINNTFN